MVALALIGSFAVAFAEIVARLGAILATTIAIFRKDVIADWLLIPYLGWVGCVAFRNFTLWRNN